MITRRNVAGAMLAFFVAWLCAGSAAGYTIVVSNIYVNQTWTPAGSPYYICYWDCTVLSNITLTIEAGVTVVLGKGEEIEPGRNLAETLKISGALIADGATFTSWTNKNPAAWANLQFQNGSVGRMTNCTIEYGGSGAVCYGLVHVWGTTDLEFADCTFRYGEYTGDSGIHIFSDATGSVQCVNCLFTNLNIGLYTERDSGVDVEIDGCTFDNLHAYGALLRNNSAVIQNCSFRNILDTDVVLWESYINNWWCKTAHLVGNQFDGGGKATFPVLMYGAVNFSASSNTLSGYSPTNQGVQVGGGIPKEWATTWASNDMGYIIRDTVTIDGDTQSVGTLTIQKGNVLKFYPDTALRVWGNLNIEGAAGQPVLLTSAVSNWAGNGIWADHPNGTIEAQYAVFDSLTRGLFVGWAGVPVTAEVSNCQFTNLSYRAFELLDGATTIVLIVRDSLIVECGESLYMDRGGYALFTNTDFVASGKLYFREGSSSADFVDCNLLALRDDFSISGWNAPVNFRHCTLAGNKGYGVSLSSSRLTDCIVWGHLYNPIYGTAITASYCCIEGGYTGPGSNNIAEPPGFIGWSGGATAYVDAAASCPGDGSVTSPFCSLSGAIAAYRQAYNYGLVTNSPCVGAASDGGNIGADNGTGPAGAASVEMHLAAGTYGLGGQDPLMGVSLVGADPSSVMITNTIRGLQSGARLENLTVAGTEGYGVDIRGPKSPTIHNCVFSNLASTAINLYGADLSGVEPCAPTITVVRIREIYSPTSRVCGIAAYGSSSEPAMVAPVIRNCMFHNIGSGASDPQGAVYGSSASLTVESSTLYTNKAGLCAEGNGTVTVWNVITYQNQYADIWNYHGRFRVGHSDYSTYTYTYGSAIWTTNNINADPLFVDREAFDLRLLPESPCINQGTNQDWMAGATDFYGNPRILHRFTDMGAYEHQYEWPMIGVAPTEGSFRAAVNEPLADWTVTVWNAGAGTLNYTISSNVSWMSVSPVSGTSTGEVDDITVSFNTAGLPPGSHTGLVTVADAAARNSPQTVRVILQLQAPAIRRNPTNLTVNLPVGEVTTSRTFEVWNGTTGTMSYVLTTNVSWLTVTPTSGTSTGEHDTITLDFDTAALASGTYSGAVTITSTEATNSPQLVNVTLNVLAPYIVRSPTTFTATTAPGASPSPETLGVRNGGPHMITYSITTNVDWLTVSPGEGSSTGEWDAILVTYSTAALPVGSHTGIVSIASPEATNSPQTATFRVHVLLPSIACSPTGFSLTAAPGVSWPDQTLRVWNGTLGVMNYALTTNVDWLSVAPTEGTSTSEQDTVTVSVRTEMLAEGVHTGMIMIISGEATNSPRNVPVVVNVLDFNRALNTTNLPWRSGGNVAWFLQTNITHDGVEAAQSGDITHNQTSWVEVALSGPATLSFWWRVSSESSYDFLRFYVDTTLVASMSGESGWTARTNIIPDGTHVMRWAYIKDYSISSGSDAGWLDEVRYVYDSDGDGLPDLWEQQYWGDPTSTNAWDGDYDGDGYSNGEEFWADTNPTNNNSFFPRLTNATPGSISLVVVSPTSTQRVYDVFAVTNLAGEQVWIPLGFNLSGTGTNLVLWVTNSVPTRFYRAGVRLP